MPLYPEVKSPKSYTINVDINVDTDTPHQLYIEECGNPKGIPVIFLHGGPGSGCNASHRSYFNPKHYRIILFDQRGCGRSTPHGCLDNNTTQHLINDIETIRLKLGVETWLLFAGSWGVTLALLYAQHYTSRVSGMILRGAFLASKRDMDWFFNAKGVARIYPELWSTLNNSLEKKDSSETLLQTYHRCLFSEDSTLNKIAAKAWSEWTNTIVTWSLLSNSTPPPRSEKETSHITNKQVRSIRLEAHYAINQYFLEEDYLINHMQVIKHLPTMLIHGRKDITCPVESSWRLHQLLTNSSLKILPDTGHLAGEPAMIEALVDATDTMIIKLDRSK